MRMQCTTIAADHSLGLEDDTLDLDDALGLEDATANSDTEAVYSSGYTLDMEVHYCSNNYKNTILSSYQSKSAGKFCETSMAKTSLSFISAEKANVISRQTSPRQTDKKCDTCCLQWSSCQQSCGTRRSHVTAARLMNGKGGRELKRHLNRF